MWFSFFESSLGVGRKSYICDLISLINLENSRPLSLLVLFLPHFSLVAQMVKNLPAIQEAWVYSLGWEDILEKEMATHSSIFAWRISWTEEPDGLHTIHGVAESDRTERLILSTFLFGGILPSFSGSQFSHLENRDSEMTS